MRSLFICLAIASASSSFASNENLLHGPTFEQKLEMQKHNGALNSPFRKFSFEGKPISNSVRPFAEYEKNGYLFFSDTTPFASSAVKHALAKNLPSEIKLVILAKTESDAEGAKVSFSNDLSESRIKTIVIEPTNGNHFWVRDGMPIPLVDTATNELVLVNAQYFHHWEPDAQISRIFDAQLVSHDYYYEGGNFMVNRLGDCILISEGAGKEPPNTSAMMNYYGCKQVIGLPRLKGIGHIDESVKFISDKVVVTDTEDYRETLEARGYTVHILPRPNGGNFQTYVNSLLLNGTLFVPVFDLETDAQAIAVYKSLGLKVVPVNSVYLSEGQGSIHCITMNYPAVPSSL